MLSTTLKLFVPLGLTLFMLNAHCQIISSTGNGDWNNPTTWSGSVVPTSANATQIIIDHEVMLPSGYAVSVFGLVVDNRLSLNAGATLTILEDAVPAIPDMLVTGTLVAEDGAVLNGTTTANTFFESGSVYVHRQGPLGFIPLATWHSNSTLIIAGFKTSGYINIAHSDGWKQTFGNVEYDCPEQTIFVVDLNGYLRNITGDFIIRNTNNQTLRLSTTQNPHIVIGGSLIVEGPSEVWFSTNGSNTLVDIQQDFHYRSSSAGPSYFTTRGTCTVSVSGNMEVDSPGSLRMTSSTADSVGARLARLNLHGDFKMLSGTMIAPPLGSGKGTLVFEGNGIQSVVASPSGTSFQGNLDYVIEGTSTVNLGNSALSNTTGTLRVWGRLQVGSTDPEGAMQLVNKGNIHIPGQRLFEDGSTLEYNASSPQWIGPGYPSAAGASLVCNNPSDINFTQDIVVKNLEVLQGIVKAELYSISIFGDVNMMEGITMQAGLINLVGDQNQQVSASGVVVKDVTINKAGNTSVTLLSPLNLSGLLSMVSQNTQLSTNSFLTLLSVSDEPGGTARIGPVASGSSISGDVTYQRYMSGEGRIYRYLSSPVENATVASLMDDFPVTGTFEDPSSGPGINSTAPSFFQYDESKGTLLAGWLPYPLSGSAQDSPLETGRGYAAYIRNGTSPTVWDVTGPLHQGTISIPVTFTSDGEPSNGWNLIGNPYACTIDWDVTGANGWTKQNISPVISLRDNGVGGGGTFYYWDGDNSYDDIPDGQIASGQSLWVRATGPNPVLTIREGVKVINDVNFHRKSSVVPGFALLLTRDGVTDKTYFKIRRGAKDGPDDWDAPKLENDLFDISVLSGDSTSRAISATDHLPCHSEIIRIGTKDLQAGSYSISLIKKLDLRNFTYMLIDRYLQRETILSEEKHIEFIVTDEPASAAFERFMIRLDEVIPDAGLRVSVPRTVCENANTQVTINVAQDGIHYSLWTKGGRRISEEYVGDGADLRIRLHADSLHDGDNLIYVQARAVCERVMLLDRVVISKELLPIIKVESNHGYLGGLVILILRATADKGDITFSWFETTSSPDTLETTAGWIIPQWNKGKSYYVSGTSPSGCKSKRVAIVEGTTDRYVPPGSYTPLANSPDDVGWYSKPDINVYPNPTSGILFIHKGEDDIQRIEIKNSLGLTICRFDGLAYTDKSGTVEIDVGFLPDGVYLAITEGRKTWHVARFFKVTK